jgi:hypothetical protein
VAKVLPAIDEKLQRFVEAQRLFFVATAPLSGDGHVNVSPKGAAQRSLRVLGPHEVAYLDLTGSGSETVAHLREPGNGRIVLMLCAFDGPPRIVRFHGRGEAITLDDPRFAEAIAPFEPLDELTETGKRAVIRVEVERVSDSCGYVVPRYEFVSERDTMDRWLENKGRDGVLAYHAERNAESLDGLPAIPSA